MGQGVNSIMKYIPRHGVNRWHFRELNTKWVYIPRHGVNRKYKAVGTILNGIFPIMGLIVCMRDLLSELYIYSPLWG